MSFVKDLEEGNTYEARILAFLVKSYPNMRLAKNPDRLGIDLLSIYGANVEVKFDRQMESTWNIFIEFECNWKPSWIFKYNPLPLFAYWCDNYFYLFKGQELQKLALSFIESKEYRIISWWDGWRSKWILIPIRDLLSKQIAVRQFYM